MNVVKMIRSGMARLGYAALWCVVMAPAAMASEAGGAALPWVGPLQMIMDSISGPIAKILGVIVIVLAGLGIAFGESGSGVRRLFQVVMGLGIAFSAASIVATLYHPSGGVAF